MHSFITFIHYFVHSYVHTSVLRAFIYTFIHACMHPVIPSFVQSVSHSTNICSSMGSYVHHTFMHSFFLHAIIHSYARTFRHSCTHPFLTSFLSLVRSFVRSFVHSFIRSLSQSFIHHSRVHVTPWLSIRRELSSLSAVDQADRWRKEGDQENLLEMPFTWRLIGFCGHGHWNGAVFDSSRTLSTLRKFNDSVDCDAERLSGARISTDSPLYSFLGLRSVSVEAKVCSTTRPANKSKRTTVFPHEVRSANPDLPRPGGREAALRSYGKISQDGPSAVELEPEPRVAMLSRQRQAPDGALPLAQEAGFGPW